MHSSGNPPLNPAISFENLFNVLPRYFFSILLHSLSKLLPSSLVFIKILPGGWKTTRKSNISHIKINNKKISAFFPAGNHTVCGGGIAATYEGFLNAPSFDNTSIVPENFVDGSDCGGAVAGMRERRGKRKRGKKEKKGREKREKRGEPRRPTRAS
jgi:hypothetical protein